MSESKQPFRGHVVSGRPVTTQDLKDAGLIKRERDPSQSQYFHVCPNCGSNDIVDFYCRTCDTDFKPKHKKLSELIVNGIPDFSSIGLNEEVEHDSENIIPLIKGDIIGYLNSLQIAYNHRALELNSYPKTRDQLELARYLKFEPPPTDEGRID